MYISPLHRILAGWPLFSACDDLLSAIVSHVSFPGDLGKIQETCKFGHGPHIDSQAAS
jgi:hypothetical protein